MSRLHRGLTYGILLYVLALHSSMAVMEIAIWALCLTELILFFRAKKFPPFPEWKPILGLVLCVSVGLLLNPEGRGFFFQIGFMRWAVVLYFLPWVFVELWSPEFERKLILVWTIAATACAVYALFQTITGVDLIRPDAHVVSFSHGVYRPVGFFSRSLAFAYSFGISFLALLLPVSRRFPKWFTVIFAVLGLATIVATEARGAWMGLIAAAIVYLAFEHRRYLVVFGVALVAIVGVLSRSESDIGIKINNMLAGNLDHSSFMRMNLWKAYIQMWKEHPFFGVGLLQGDLLVPAYYTQLGIQEEFVSNAHNTYLQWLAGAGLFALLFFLWVCGAFLWRAWKLRKRHLWGWSILMAQIFLFTGAFTENNFFTAIINHMLIFTWSILLGLEAVDRAKRRV